MLELTTAAGLSIGGRRLHVIVTERTDGDLHPERVAADELRQRQTRLTGRPWLMARQVHGVDVWRPGRRAPTAAHPIADIVASADDPVAMWAADCATLLLATGDGRLVGAHAGWRGLAAGVVETAIAVAGVDEIEFVALGPMIHPCCYEFSDDDLAVVAGGVGATPAEVRSTTRTGAVALDVPAAVSSALGRHGLEPCVVAEGCTGCSSRWWSHRVGVDRERHALVGWWA